MYEPFRHLVELLGQAVGPSQGLYLDCTTHINVDKHSCPSRIQISNPRSYTPHIMQSL